MKLELKMSVYTMKFQFGDNMIQKSDILHLLFRITSAFNVILNELHNYNVISIIYKSISTYSCNEIIIVCTVTIIYNND